MFYQLVSQLQPFQATKASTNHYGTTQIGATVHSSGQHHKPRKLQAFSPHKPRNPKRPLWQELCRHRAQCHNCHQTPLKLPIDWFKRLGRSCFQASDSLSSWLVCILPTNRLLWQRDTKNHQHRHANQPSTQTRWWQNDRCCQNDFCCCVLSKKSLDTATGWTRPGRWDPLTEKKIL